MGQYAIMALDYGALDIIKIEEGLDFILGQFEEPVWPRAIFTKTLGKQYTVYNKEEAIARFKQSNLMDCRINAYPDYCISWDKQTIPEFYFRRYRSMLIHNRQRILGSSIRNMQKH